MVVGPWKMFGKSIKNMGTWVWGESSGKVFTFVTKKPGVQAPEPSEKAGLGWSHGSMVQSTCSSCRGLEFWSQNLTWTVHNYLWLKLQEI